VEEAVFWDVEAGEYVGVVGVLPPHSRLVGEVDPLAPSTSIDME
jgi:hypothetical protein